VEAGSNVAIFGLGGVGLAALLGAKATGALTIVAVDILPEKLRQAKQLGATHTLLAGTDLDVVTALKDITTGGAQYTFETAGNESALVQAYQATKRGGTTIAVGLPHPQKMFSVPAVSLVAEERVVKGSYMGSAVPSRDIPRYIRMYREGVLPVDKLLTHRLPLDQINSGFDRLARGEALRQMVMFDE
jgi:Zn-dependent alcohol dehydrogenase